MGSYTQFRRLLRSGSRSVFRHVVRDAARSVGSPYMRFPRFMSGLQLRYMEEGRLPPVLEEPEAPRDFWVRRSAHS